MKANPSPEVLSLLASMGSCFDTATVAEIEMALAAGATPDRVSYGNTIKKECDIARAFALGIRLFAVDCAAEVEKVARAAPGAKVFCRILYDCAGAEWPLSRKFGCDPEMAVDVLDLAKRLGLEPCGISFHVGSQQRKVKAWDRALAMASTVFRDCAERGINLSMVNMGGGSRPSTSRTFLRSCSTAGRSSVRCASISATRSRKPSSSRDAAWSEMPASSRPKSF